MYTPVKPGLLYKSGVKGGQNYISMFSDGEVDSSILESGYNHYSLQGCQSKMKNRMVFNVDPEEMAHY